MKSTHSQTLPGKRIISGLIGLALFVAIPPGCTAPVTDQAQDQNDDTNDNNDGDVQFNGFSFDVELGRNGPLALPVESCNADDVRTTTGAGTFESTVVTSETVSQPYINVSVTAPKNTNSGVIITDCGLSARFGVTTGSSSATTATADLTATIRLDADQNGESAGGYQLQVGLSAFEVSSTSPDTMLGQDLGNVEKSYCVLPLTCNDALPADNNFVGMERFGLSLGNIELRANSEYIIIVVVSGSIVAAEGTPDLLGGTITARATVESIELTFNNDN